ncbi:MAG TPA: LamG domain-containing protein, partial [Pseudomonadales bacterium]|nr:LamG domain-containing protein [Pseudomonadales bacterium]
MALLAFAACEFAHAVTYTATPIASNWISSAGHTAITSWASGLGCPDTAGDDSLSAPLDIGFTFKFGTTSYTQVRVNTNGRLMFANTYCGYGTQAVGPPRTYPNPLPSTNLNNVMQVYGADLDLGAGGSITYKSTGTAPNRIFVVTWNNVSAWREGGSDNRGNGTSYNLQIQLYENGDFYFVYGISDDITEPTNTAVGPAQVGWQLTSGDYALVSTGLPANNSAIRFSMWYAEYRMDEGSWNGTAGEVADTSGNGHNGSRIDSPLQAAVVQTISAGKVCRAMDVPDNGGNAQVDAVNSTVAPQNVGTSGTITFWYRARVDWNGTSNYLFDATTQSSKFFYLGKSNNSRLQFGVTDNAASPMTLTAQTANTGVAANTWKHIAVTWQLATGSNASSINIYLDGALVATATGTTNGQLNATLGSLYIGDARSSATNGLTGSPTSANGAIDEFRIYSRVLSATEIQTVMAETRASCPAPAVARFLISHSGFGINCRVEPITMYVLDGFNNLVTSYSGGVTLTTQSGRGTWTLLAGNGALVDATPDDGLASYQFVPADGGQATFGLNYSNGPSPIDIDIYQTDDSTIRDDDTEGLLAFGPSGFTVTGAALSNPPPATIASPIGTQIAATPFSIYLTAFGQTPTDPNCGVIETYTGAHALAFWMDHVNPTPGVLNATVNGTAVGANEAAASTQSITFASGQAAVTAKYKDVGSIRINMKDSSAKPTELRGGTNAFVVKPAQLAVSKVETLGGIANPAATSATGAGFVGAGAAFRVEVDALDSEGSLTPSYGTESPAEGVRISSNALVVPAAGRNGSSGTGALGNSTAFAATATPGRFRNDSVSFDEVGIIRLAATVADGDYLGGGAVASTVSGNVGRFYPAQFALNVGSTVTAACNVFTYMDQPKLGVGYTIEARNAAGNRTQNYDASLLGAGAVATLNAVAENNDSGVDLGGRLNGIVGDWVLGAVTISTNTATFARAASPDGSFDALALGIRTTDPLSNVTLANMNMNAATSGDCIAASSCNAVEIGSPTQIRYGRLMVKPAFGPETQNLGVTVEA